MLYCSGLRIFFLLFNDREEDTIVRDKKFKAVTRGNDILLE